MQSNYQTLAAKIPAQVSDTFRTLFLPGKQFATRCFLSVKTFFLCVRLEESKNLEAEERQRLETEIMRKREEVNIFFFSTHTRTKCRDVLDIRPDIRLFNRISGKKTDPVHP